MSIARQHVNALDIITCDFELYHFICTQLALLNQTMTRHHNKELPLGIVPMLSLGNTWLGDIDAYLTSIQRMHQLSKRTAVIHIHFQRE